MEEIKEGKESLFSKFDHYNLFFKGFIFKKKRKEKKQKVVTWILGFISPGKGGERGGNKGEKEKICLKVTWAVPNSVKCILVRSIGRICPIACAY